MSYLCPACGGVYMHTEACPLDQPAEAPPRGVIEGPETFRVEWWRTYALNLAKQLEAADMTEQRLREALVKIRAHTAYAFPTVDLLCGLLASIERIADAATSAPKGEE